MNAFRGLLFFLSSLMIAGNAVAQAPGGGYRILVGYPPGGGTDTVARHVAVGLAEALGQPVIVENRPGASGLLAGEAVSRAGPSSGLLLNMESAFTVNPYLIKNWTLNPYRDFTPVSLIGSAPLFLVVPPAVAARTLKDLIALAKANPGKLTYGSAGSGNTTHLSPELLKFKAGLDIVQVPYKGSGPAVTDLLAGRISMMFTGISAVRGHVNEGKLHPIAVTGTSRAPVFPQVPTLAEAGMPIPELNLGTWWGLVGPPGMPRDTLARLAQAIRTATENAAVREKLAALNIRTINSSPEEFSRLIREESASYGDLIKRTNIRLGD